MQDAKLKNPHEPNESQTQRQTLFRPSDEWKQLKRNDRFGTFEIAVT